VVVVVDLALMEAQGIVGLVMVLLTALVVKGVLDLVVAVAMEVPLVKQVNMVDLALDVLVPLVALAHTNPVVVFLALAQTDLGTLVVLGLVVQVLLVILVVQTVLVVLGALVQAVLVDLVTTYQAKTAVVSVILVLDVLAALGMIESMMIRALGEELSDC
jgi:hypothetical protein